MIWISFDCEDRELTEDSRETTVINFCWRDKNGYLRHSTFVKQKGEGDFDFRFRAISWLDSFVGKDDCGLIAHNAEYDLVALFREEMSQFVDEIVLTIRPVITRIGLGRGAKISLYDSMNWAPMSLKKIGKIVGLEKMEVDLLTDDLNELVPYCQRDCEIPLVFHEQLSAKIEGLFGEPLKATIASTATNILHTKYLHKIWSPYNEAIAIDAYYGGRCEPHHIGRYSGDISMADVNSMYPYVMTLGYPDTREPAIDFHEWSKRTKKQASVQNLFRFLHGTIRATVKVPMQALPPLPTRDEKTGRIHYRVGILEGTWTMPELRYACRLCGCKIQEIHEAKLWDMEVFPFREAIQTWYNLRLIAKKEKNVFEIEFWKLMMNSSYGKLAERSDRRTVRNKEFSSRDYAKLKDKGVRSEDVTLMGTKDGMYSYRVPIGNIPATAHYIWAAYVTSYARVHLHKTLSLVAKTPGAELMYYDTDSCYWLGATPEGVDLDQERLGAWKIEKCDEIFVVGPKRYMYGKNDGGHWHWDGKVAGYRPPKRVWEECQTREPSKFYQMDNPVFAYLSRQEMVETEAKPSKLLSSIRNNRTPGIWSPAKKTMKDTYSRRIVRKDGSTKARRNY